VFLSSEKADANKTLGQKLSKMGASAPEKAHDLPSVT